MRKIKLSVLSAVFVLMGLQLLSQSDTAQKRSARKGTFEAGANLYGLTFRPGNFYTRYKEIADQQFFSGLYMKYHKGLNALRWELNYSQRNLRYRDDYQGSLRGGTQTKSLEIKMGYQRSFGRRKFSVYGFADLEYNYFWPTYPYSPYPFSYPASLSSYYYDNARIISGSFFCLSPGIGLRWKITKHLVVNAETTAQFFYAREKPDYYTTNKPIQSIGINAKPIRLSVGFLF